MHSSGKNVHDEMCKQTTLTGALFVKFFFCIRLRSLDVFSPPSSFLFRGRHPPATYFCFFRFAQLSFPADFNLIFGVLSISCTMAKVALRKHAYNIEYGAENLPYVLKRRKTIWMLTSLRMLMLKMTRRPVCKSAYRHIKSPAVSAFFFAFGIFLSLHSRTFPFSLFR